MTPTREELLALAERLLSTRWHGTAFSQDAGAAGMALRQIAEAMETPERNNITLRVFCGWLVADLPELHRIEIGRIADSLDRFLAAYPAAQQGKE